MIEENSFLPESISLRFIQFNVHEYIQRFIQWKYHTKYIAQRSISILEKPIVQTVIIYNSKIILCINMLQIEEKRKTYKKYDKDNYQTLFNGKTNAKRKNKQQNQELNTNIKHIHLQC